MEEHILYIKNMVCPRCIAAIENTLDTMNIPYNSVELGQVILSGTLSTEKQEIFKENIKNQGFELLEPGRSSLISRIKTLIIEQVHHAKTPLHTTFSVFLSENLSHEYSYLSRLFSSVEGITIEKFIAAQKIEKVKEMLFYDELSLSEIANKMEYSSVSYLSTQFKKETGMTPSAFRKSHLPRHRRLDTI